MTWFKVDDSLAFHAKVVAAGNPAMGLWVRAGSWCSQQLTNGTIPEHIAASIGTAQQAARLVAVGLWETVPEGYAFHEWASDGRQPTREQVESKREYEREKKRRQRRDSAGQYTSVPVMSPGESPGSPVGSPQGSPTVPSRPVPSRPTTSPNGDVVGEPKTPRETPLPASWEPSDEHRARAASTGLDVDREAVKFRAHAEEKGRRAKSWGAAFTRWLMNAADYADRDRTRGTTDRQGLILQREMDAARIWDAQHDMKALGA